ncbi:MAG: hypothetical protein DRG30_00225 [Epsilonproteobacteria bacterium]|nr:MAG: hypothetical protein DRG30_00225 [Campylobacterota bacterium]
MKIIGHPWVESESFAQVDAVEKIISTPTGSVLLISDISRSINLLHYCESQGLPFALRAMDIKTALFAHALHARYVIVKKEMAGVIQGLAQNYLFDTQVIVEIEHEDEIEEYARMGIDGVIFPSAIK